MAYELYGCIVHEGLRNSTSCGHYVAYVRTADGAWWACNDGDVRAPLLPLCILPSNIFNGFRGCHCSAVPSYLSQAAQFPAGLPASLSC